MSTVSKQSIVNKVMPALQMLRAYCEQYSIPYWQLVGIGLCYSCMAEIEQDLYPDGVLRNQSPGMKRYQIQLMGFFVDVTGHIPCFSCSMEK